MTKLYPNIDEARVTELLTTVYRDVPSLEEALREIDDMVRRARTENT